MPRTRSQADNCLNAVTQAHKNHQVNINKPLPTITGILLGNAINSAAISGLNKPNSRKSHPKGTFLNVRAPHTRSPKQNQTKASSPKLPPTAKSHGYYVPPVSRRAHLVISVMQFLEAEEKDMLKELRRVETSINEAHCSLEELKERRGFDLDQAAEVKIDIVALDT